MVSAVLDPASHLTPECSPATAPSSRRHGVHCQPGLFTAVNMFVPGPGPGGSRVTAAHRRDVPRYLVISRSAGCTVPVVHHTRQLRLNKIHSDVGRLILAQSAIYTEQLALQSVGCYRSLSSHSNTNDGNNWIIVCAAAGSAAAPPPHPP